MQEFFGNSNREILIEVLHHSIDYLIGNRDDQQTLRMCHKYGFQNPDDFLLATRTLSKYYKNCCTDNAEIELSTKFTGASPELLRLLPLVLKARRPEIMAYLARQEYATDQPLVESFDWDTRLILGDNFSRTMRQLATLTLQCRRSNSTKHLLFFEMDKDMLSKVISVIEEALETDGQISK